jgi:hypothetical protein
MKRFLKLTLYLIAYVLCFSSCDKVKDPYNATGGGDTTTVVKVRKVLLEDYTGHKCGNCPDAAVTAQTIKSTYGERLVIMAVHAGFFANVGAVPFNYNFKTTPGTDYDNFFGNGAAGNPNGLINRVDYPASTHIKNYGNWGTIVATLMAKAPDAYIEISNNYNSGTRVLNTTVNTEFLNMLTGTYKLVVLLTEDSIVKPQKFYVPAKDSLTYVHHHVLRDAISSTSWGDVIATGSVAAGDTVVNTFIYTLPATFPTTSGIAPNENKCYVVAFVYDATTYEVIQVEEKKIK